MKSQNIELPLVSIAVLTYNPPKEKLFQTIQSIIEQKGIDFELVLADDGSEKTYFKEVEKLLQDNSFTNYKLVENQMNQGTVRNCLSAVRACEGKYVKLFSPGDFFSSNIVLHKWVNYMEENTADWSFCDAFYYIQTEQKIQLIEQDAHPQEITPYLEKKRYKYRWNYIVNGDLCLGAATICKKDILLKYLNIIKDKVIYAEDNIYRIMMVDDIDAMYYQETAIMYEVGDGVSTSNNSEWIKHLENDWKNATQIMMERCDRTQAFGRRLYKAFLVEEMTDGYVRKFKRFFMRGCLWYNIRQRIKKRKTEIFFCGNLNR